MAKAGLCMGSKNEVHCDGIREKMMAEIRSGCGRREGSRCCFGTGSDQSGQIKQLRNDNQGLEGSGAHNLLRIVHEKVKNGCPH